MFPTGRCRNCGVPTHEIRCSSCRNHRRCTRCYRYLPAHLFPIDSDVCNACQNRGVNNVGRYCLDQVIGDRTWYGTTSDIDVSNFVQHRAYMILQQPSNLQETRILSSSTSSKWKSNSVGQRRMETYNTQQLDSMFHL